MPKITYTGYLIFRRVPLSSSLIGTCYLRKNTLEKRNLYLFKYSFMIASTHVTVPDLEFYRFNLGHFIRQNTDLIVQGDSRQNHIRISPAFQ